MMVDYLKHLIAKNSFIFMIGALLLLALLGFVVLLLPEAIIFVWDSLVPEHPMPTYIARIIAVTLALIFKFNTAFSYTYTFSENKSEATNHNYNYEGR